MTTQLREPIDVSILGSDTDTQCLETQGIDESGDRMRFVGHTASSIVRANATEKEEPMRFHRLALHRRPKAVGLRKAESPRGRARRWGSQDRTRLAIRRRMTIVRPESSQTDVKTRASRILRSA